MNEPITPFRYRIVRDFVDFVPYNAIPPKREYNRFRVVLSYAILGSIGVLLAHFSGMTTALASHETETGRILGVAAVVLGGLAIQAIAALCWLAYKRESE